MIKNVFFVVAFFTIQLSCAQDTSGYRFLLGGNVGFNYSEEDPGTFPRDYLTVSINPSFGVFISPNTALGVQLGFQYFDAGGNSFTETTFSVAPFARIHALLSNKFMVYWQPGIAKEWYYRNGSSLNWDVYRAGVDLGLLYFLKNSLSLELNIAGLQYTYVNRNNEALNSIRFNANFVQPNIGVRFYLD